MDASQKLGQKLLQGWTMLGESCFICNVPLMRSRDGIQTICVVCEPKQPTAGTEQVPAVSEPVDSDSSSDDEPGYSPERAAAQARQSELEKRQKDLYAISNVLLDSLDYSLASKQPIEVFSDILESALKPLKSLSPLKKDDYCVRTISAIEDKISEKLKCTCSSTDPKIVISYFNSVDRLIKLYNQFKEITK